MRSRSPMYCVSLDFTQDNYHVCHQGQSSNSSQVVRWTVRFVQMAFWPWKWGQGHSSTVLVWCSLRTTSICNMNVLALIVLKLPYKQWISCTLAHWPWKWGQGHSPTVHVSPSYPEVPLCNFKAIGWVYTGIKIFLRFGQKMNQKIIKNPKITGAWPFVHT